MPINVVNVQPEVIYWHRLIALADSIVEGCDAIFEATHEAEVRHPYFRADPATHARIDAVLLAAANVRKLVFPSTRFRKSEGAAIRKLRTRRAERMQEALAGLTFEQIRNTAVRNTLEHFGGGALILPFPYVSA